jgi:hypothetical protein
MYNIIFLGFFPYPGIPPPMHHLKETRKKTRGSYENWFAEDKWALIEAVVKKHRSMSGALHYLKLTHRYASHPHFSYSL